MLLRWCAPARRQRQSAPGPAGPRVRVPLGTLLPEHRGIRARLSGRMGRRPRSAAAGGFPAILRQHGQRGPGPGRTKCHEPGRRRHRSQFLPWRFASFTHESAAARHQSTPASVRGRAHWRRSAGAADDCQSGTRAAARNVESHRRGRVAVVFRPGHVLPDLHESGAKDTARNQHPKTGRPPEL